MQSAIVSNRLIIGIVAFGVSFGLSLVLSWDFNKAFLTGFVTVPATYLAALFVDKRQRNHEMLILDSQQRRIRDLEGLKSRIVTEVNQLEAHNALLHAELSNLQNQVVERRNQRDSLNRELSTYVMEKKQLEGKINYLQNELHTLEQSKIELNKTFSTLTAEKRRLELNYSVSRSEITQLQTQITELQQQKEELESSLTLLNRLKPQLEEKLYELRVQIQELEVQENQQKQFILEKETEKKHIQASLNALKTQLAEQQTQLQQLQGQVTLLQEERDQLQSQVWELLHQMETLTTQEQLNDNGQEESEDFFPFSELIESIESIETTASSEKFSEEWAELTKQLQGYEIRILKAMLEQDNPKAVMKKIAEDNITMPNLLIDSINELANDTIGELIIDPSSETPEIYEEHKTNLKKVVAMYDYKTAEQTSLN
ncbi:MAG: tellurite resistance TerB C-terminal domain-containing protein [Brasilonema sp.]